MRRNSIELELGPYNLNLSCPCSHRIGIALRCAHFLFSFYPDVVEEQQEIQGGQNEEEDEEAKAKRILAEKRKKFIEL